MLSQLNDKASLFSERSTTTSLDIDDPNEEQGWGKPILGHLDRFARYRPCLANHLGRWILAASVTTIPIAYYDPRKELYGSGVLSSVWAMISKESLGQAISLSEARRLALQVLQQTELRLRRERESDEQCFLNLWGEDHEL